jgi:hypothetical protein
MRNAKGQFIKGNIEGFKKGHKINLGRRWKMKEKFKEKISLIKIGNKNGRGNKGRKHTPEEIKKMKAAESGPNHWHWKGGITKLVNQIRTCLKYRQWRLNVFSRDYFTCANCGQKGGELVAHHIKAFAEIMKEHNIKTLQEALECEELWDIENGITLCEECHG